MVALAPSRPSAPVITTMSNAVGSANSAWQCIRPAYARWKSIVTLSPIVLSVGVSAGVGLVFGSTR